MFLLTELLVVFFFVDCLNVMEMFLRFLNRECFDHFVYIGFICMQRVLYK